MCNLYDERVSTHKEATLKRMKWDQKDVESLVLRFTSGMIKNPFDLKVDKDTADNESLNNITTGILLREKVIDRCIDASSTGHLGMLRFITSRL